MVTLIALEVHFELADVGGGLISKVQLEIQHGGELVDLFIDG